MPKAAIAAMINDMPVKLQIVFSGQAFVQPSVFEQSSAPRANLIGLRLYVEAQHFGAPARRLEQAQKQNNSRGLARSIRSEKSENDSGGDFQTKIIHRANRTEVSTQIFSANSDLVHPAPLFILASRF
jgi:hypothetical protein